MLDDVRSKTNSRPADTWGDPVEPAASPVDDCLHRSPWRTIWTAPRSTIRSIVSRDPGLSVTALLCLHGIGQSLGRASDRNAGDAMTAPMLAAAVLLGGAIGGVFGGWLLSHMLRVSGHWIGGSSDRRNLLAAVAWAGVPTVAGVALWVPQLAVAGMDMFTSATPRIDGSPLALGVLLLCAVIGLVLAIWSLVLTCHTVAEVQGFRSAWVGFGNLLLAGVLLVGIVLGIVACVVGLSLLMSP